MGLICGGSYFLNGFECSLRRSRNAHDSPGFTIPPGLSGRTRHTSTGMASTTGAGHFGHNHLVVCYLPSLDFGMRVLSCMDGLASMPVSDPSIMLLS